MAAEVATSLPPYGSDDLVLLAIAQCPVASDFSANRVTKHGPSAPFGIINAKASHLRLEFARGGVANGARLVSIARAAIIPEAAAAAASAPATSTRAAVPFVVAGYSVEIFVADILLP